jgi:hypothetical protein
VSSVLVGIDRREYLDAAVEVARRGPLPAELMRTLRGLDLPDPDFIDLPRWDREGWLT